MRQKSIPWPAPAATDTAAPPITTVDLVVPVHNEESSLAASVQTLLEADLGPGAEVSIVIADNASTDATPTIAEALARTHDRVRCVRLEEKGRGRALKRVWSDSEADVLAYTDVDLATDIRALGPMIEAVRSGIADVSIASRLLPGLAIARGVKREIISRCYNRLLRLCLGTGFSDAQCGLKVISARAAEQLLPVVEDTGWFFDTELLARAEWAGLRVHEFGTDWTDDPDSSVAVAATAWEDIKGIARLRRSPRMPVLRPIPSPNTGAQILHFIDVGVLSTILYGVLFVLGIQVLSPTLANLAALVLSTVANTALNRSHTFGVRTPHDRMISQLKGFAAFALCFAFTSAGLALSAGMSTMATLLVLTIANLAATCVRFGLMRTWVFATRSHRPGRRSADV